MNLTVMLDVAAAIIAGGVVGALMWEAVKIYFPVRGFCHTQSIDGWMHGADGAKKDLLELLANEAQRDAVLQQTTPRLMAAIQAACATAAEHPESHPALFDFLTGNSADGVTWKEFKKTDDPNPKPDAEQKAFRARDAIERAIERRLNDLQAYCDYHWAKKNHRWSLVAGFVVTIVTLTVTTMGSPNPTPGPSWPAMLRAGLMAFGLAIPVAFGAALVALLAEETLRSYYEGRER